MKDGPAQRTSACRRCPIYSIRSSAWNAEAYVSTPGSPRSTNSLQLPLTHLEDDPRCTSPRFSHVHLHMIRITTTSNCNQSPPRLVRQTFRTQKPSPFPIQAGEEYHSPTMRMSPQVMWHRCRDSSNQPKLRFAWTWLLPPPPPGPLVPDYLRRGKLFLRVPFRTRLPQRLARRRVGAIRLHLVFCSASIVMSASLSPKPRQPYQSFNLPGSILIQRQSQ